MALTMILVTSAKEVRKIARKVRKSQKMDQQTAGSVANCGLTFVSHFENGKPTVQLEKALQMLDALGVRVYLDVPPEN